MGSQLVDILRQGVWASLTGGWYYDPHNRILTNTLHLYLWLGLFCMPFALHLFCPTGPWYVWLPYILFILIVFTAIKAINQTLHRLFDTGEVHETIVDTSRNDFFTTAATDMRYDSGGFELRPIRTEPKPQSSPVVAPRPPPSPPDELEQRGGLRNRRIGGATRALVREDSSRFDLKVDVHESKQELATAEESADGPYDRPGDSQEDAEARRSYEKECVVGGDVTIVVHEDIAAVGGHRAQAQTVLEEGESPCRLVGGSGGNAVFNDASFSTNSSSQQIGGNTNTANSSQLTMPGFRNADSNTRRFSNLSDLARSLPSEPGGNALQPHTTRSLQIMAILDPNLGQLGARRCNFGRPGRSVRRTRSALDPGLGCVAPMSSYPVSLDAGINSELNGSRGGPRALPQSPETKTFGKISEGSEETSSREGELDDRKPNSYVKGTELESYVEELMEIMTGHFPRDTRAKSADPEKRGADGDWRQSSSQSFSTFHDRRPRHQRPAGSEVSQGESDTIATGLVLRSVSVKDTPLGDPASPTPAAYNHVATSSPLTESGLLPDWVLGKDDGGSEEFFQDERSRLETEQPRCLRSTMGMGWPFSDSEPEQQPSSPKQVPLAGEERQGRVVEPATKSRDSSHGSSGTDTETRTLLNKLEEVEASLEACGGNSGAIPKRRQKARKQTRRPNGGEEEEEEEEEEDAYRSLVEYSGSALPERTTLHQDVAGLKLFLDILNGPFNPEAEAELRKLIQKKRNLIGGEYQPSAAANSRHAIDEEEPRSKRRLATRRRRHHAQAQGEDQFPLPTDQEEEKASRRRIGDKRRCSREKEERRDTHIAESHNDTSAGAVHCYQDEFGNWHTYTFGQDTATTTDLAACTAGTNYASLLYGGRQLSVEEGGAASQPAAAVTGASSSRPSGPYSHSSSDSGLTVILDSPAMVFQPTVTERQRSRDSNAGDNFWVGSTASQRDSYWSRDNTSSGNASRYNTGLGAATSQAFRRYNNPLSMFAENFRDRLPGGGSGVGGGSTAVVAGDVTYSSYSTVANTSGGGEGSTQLSRIEESGGAATALSSGAQLNLCISVPGAGSSHQATDSFGSTADQRGGGGAPRVRRYHLLRLPGMQRGIRVFLDRLQLLNILDQDPSWGYSILGVVLATATAVLGSQVLTYNYYHDHWLVLYCLVLCSCQYSLVKSVQPDASSPTHGFNTATVYSRPVYFLVLCCIILLVESSLASEPPEFELYARKWGTRDQLLVARDVVYGLILSFPIIFTMGLLPQINTAAMYLMEQIDILVFGGNAVSSIQSGLYCVVRSLLVVGVLVGFAYGGVTERTHTAHAQQVLFSIFVSLSVALSYHLSRASSDPTVILSIMKRHFLAIISEDTGAGGARSPESEEAEDPEEESAVPRDPLPKKLRDTVNARLKNDIIVCMLISVILFLLHQSDVFAKTFPQLDIVLWIMAMVAGFLLHYLLPHLRKQTPWKCIAAPVLLSHEHGQFEVRQPAKVMWWEKFLLWASILERSVLYPLIFISAVTQDRLVFKSQFGLWGGSLMMTICLVKCLRSAFSDCSRQYITLLMAVLIFQYNPSDATINNVMPGCTRQSPFLLDYFLTSILMLRLTELYLKCQFVITYIAPHQINWGSAFHAFAQPFSVPHSAMLFLQAAVSSALSSPLNPLLGSTIFICSYVRPIKFWERNYNTKRADNSNTRLSTQVELRNPGADDNNLNSIFYEHLTRSLQHSLAGDLQLGRWGEVQQGDFFVLASDYLNCLVHIIELGNGLCTFQVRGLEFRGTYCHQREVEAISEGVEEDEGCCCCEPGHLPHMLSLNAAFSQRWLAWEVSAVKYVLEGYSISDNSAGSMLQVYDLRKILVSYYVKAIIYYTVRSPRLQEWLSNPGIRDAIRLTAAKSFVDLDPLFNCNIDEDFDYRASGITRHSFCSVYLPWLQYCAKARDQAFLAAKDSDLVSLCLSLSLLGRRALGAAGHNALSTVEFFLVGLHALFKGDFRITSVRDEWVFSDMELLRKVVAPAVRMSLKLHQDHFMSPDEYEESSVLYDAITTHEKDLVISHEGDPAWRSAVLSGAPSLLALRHVVDDGSDEYKIIMLNKRFLSFRVIKLNRECVRGLWAGQQQELIFLRNRNPERGSIQNAKQALRNIINSSCDQPIGYPIYVSPLTTSYIDTNPQVCGVVGGPVSLGVVRRVLLAGWSRLRDRCIAGCSSGSAGVDCDVNNTGEMTLPDNIRGSSLPGNRSSVVSTASKPSTGTLVSLAGLLGTQPASSSLERTGGGLLRTRNVSEDSGGTPATVRLKKVSLAPPLPTPPPLALARIVDPLLVYDNLNLGRRIDPVWPEPEWRAKGGRNAWNNWIPVENMVGVVVHRWSPVHPHPMHRSHTDKTILLLKIEDKYVPIAEQAVEIISQDELTFDAFSERLTSSMEEAMEARLKARRDSEARPRLEQVAEAPPEEPVYCDMRGRWTENRRQADQHRTEGDLEARQRPDNDAEPRQRPEKDGEMRPEREKLKEGRRGKRRPSSNDREAAVFTPAAVGDKASASEVGVEAGKPEEVVREDTVEERIQCEQEEEEGESIVELRASRLNITN